MGNRTIIDLLNEQVGFHPDKTFLIFEDMDQGLHELTYGEFSIKMAQLSQVFLDLNVKKGSHVTLHLPNCLEFMISWFALANIGAIMVPTNTLSTADEMAYIMNHSESTLLITEEEYLGKFERIRDQLPHLQNILLGRYHGCEYAGQSLNQLMEKANHKPQAAISIQSEDVVAMLYTSGTTSRPKGCLITHANYLYTGEVVSKTIRLSPNDRAMIVLPLFHGNGQYYLAMPALTVGASIAITERFSASRYVKQAKRMGATVGSLFAAPIRMILRQQYDKEDIHNLLRLIIFAQSVSAEQLDLFEKRYHTSLVQLYGMTETVAPPLMNPLDGKRKNMGIGRPTVGSEVKVIDKFGKELPPLHSGQIIIKGVPGRTLMRGYYKNPKATEETIKDGWLYSGDQAQIDEDGYFVFIDREKDMIKRAGENIAASEIESVLSEHPAVFEASVIGVPDEIRDESVKAYIILNDEYELSEKDILDYCKDKLAKFKVPSRIEMVTEFPRTSVGKIQKHILRQWYEKSN
ncbi:AMP-binding protein [Cytobacillus oceanisediminis]|uniref:AMP-binding protein n=1 Tax=Cytobacillus oceanisediminis TaxID=665099 RepID=UPI0037361395